MFGKKNGGVVKLVRDLDILALWDSAQNEKRFESTIEDKWGRKAVLTRKAEVSHVGICVQYA